ncbi:MAG: Ig-like domain-containing protein [Deltaproteobacteria bacterium]|nr:Ig-like domain-containing protein [Deltaproteobacteria bacterium]
MSFRSLALALVVVSVAACPTDEEGPATPKLDPVVGVTSLEVVSISGRAEPNARVVVAGGAAAAEAVADAAEGSFRVEVNLALGDNALSVTAVDAASNSSEPVEVAVRREAPRAEIVRMSLENVIVDADGGVLAVNVQVQNDEPEIPLASLGVTLTVEGYGQEIIAVPVLLDASGAGRGVLEGLTIIGGGLVVATADVPDSQGNKARATAGFVVLAGAAVDVDVELSATVDGVSTGPAALIAVPPLTPTRATVTVTDEAGNVVVDAPLVLALEPDAGTIVGNQIEDVAIAGTYRVVALVGEGLVGGSATLEVVPGVPARLELELSSDRLVAGAVLIATARVVDAVGNVTSTPVTLTDTVPDQDLLGDAQPLVLTDLGTALVGAIEVRTAGSFFIQASAGGLSAEAPFVIIPGAADGGSIAVAPDPLVAGQTATVIPSFVDAFLNPTDGDFTVVTDAPGAITAGGTIIGITRASDAGVPYRVLVRTETGTILSVDLVVIAAAPSRLLLTLSATDVEAGSVVTSSASAVDVFGNRTSTPVTMTDTIPDLDLRGAAQALVLTDLGTELVGEIQVLTAGSFVVSAATGGLTAEVALVVRPGPTAAGTVSIAPSPVVAGQTATAIPSFVDAFLNPTAETFSVVTDAPGALVSGDTIINLTQASEGGPPFRVIVRTATGLAVTADLVVVAAAPNRTRLSLSSNEVAAGTTVTATAEVIDLFGNRVRTAAPLLSEDAPENFSPAPLSIDGVTTGTIAVTTAATFTITADAAGLLATSTLTVRPGPPVNGDFIEVDPAFLPYRAGDTIFLNYSFVDAFGNLSFDVPLVVSINAPNVSITDNGAGVVEINGVVRSGNFTIRGRALGTGLADDVEIVTVDPNPQNAGFNLSLSAGLVSEGGSLVFSATDGFGNAIPAGDLVVSASDPSVVQAGNRLTFPNPGTFSITARLLANAAISDTEFVSVQGNVDTVPPVASVTITFPDPAVTNEVPINGLVTFRVDSSDERGLSELRFVATFTTPTGNNGFCSVQGGPVLLAAGTLSDTRTFSFSAPGCAVPLDRIDIVAQAVDGAGNSTNAANQTPLSIAANFAVSAPGFLVEVAAFRDRLDQPQDVAVDPATGQLFVTNFGNDRVIVVAPDRTQEDLFDTNNNRVSPVEPRGIARDLAGNLLIHSRDPGGNNGLPGVERVRPDLVDDAPFIDLSTLAGAYPDIGVGIAVDESAGLPARLCAALDNNNRLQCFDDFSLAGATPALVINLTTNLGSTRPIAVAFDPPAGADASDKLWVALNTTRVLRPFTFNAARTVLTQGADINVASVVAAQEMGDLLLAPGTENLLFTDRNDGDVIRVSQAGAISTLASGFSDPIGLAFDGASLFVVDRGLEIVFKITPDPANPASF